MNRQSAWRNAAIVAPLFGATLVSTLLRPATAHTLALALAPLGWAAFVVIASSDNDSTSAYAWVLPFSAYAVTVFAEGPRIPALAFALAGAVASTAVAALAGSAETGLARWKRRAAMLAGWVPGCAVAFGVDAWSGLAVAVMTALVALYIHARRTR